MISQKGFTLIELMVVLIIIGIASSLVFISMGRGVFSAKEKGLVKDLGQRLSEARTRSIGQGRPVYFLIYGDERAFGIANEKKTPIPEDVEVRGIGVEDYEEGIYAILFYPDGSSSGGTIILSMPGGNTYYFKIDRFFGGISLETEQD